MAISALAQWGAIAAILGILNGTVPGFDGYVRQSGLRELEQLARETREDQIIAEIFDFTRRYCLAYESNDNSGMQTAFQQLQFARSKYFRLMRREYPQLMCSVSAQPSKSPAQ